MIFARTSGLPIQTPSRSWCAATRWSMQVSICRVPAASLYSSPKQLHPCRALNRSVDCVVQEPTRTRPSIGSISGTISPSTSTRHWRPCREMSRPSVYSSILTCFAARLTATESGTDSETSSSTRVASFVPMTRSSKTPYGIANNGGRGSCISSTERPREVGQGDTAVREMDVLMYRVWPHLLVSARLVDCLFAPW